MESSCRALETFDTVTSWINVVGGLGAFYVAIRVHSMTKSTWKSFLVFILASLLVGVISIMYAWRMVQANPCMLREMNAQMGVDDEV